MRMIYVPSQQLSLNKLLLALLGRLSFSQYIMNKGHKYGIKHFELTRWDRLILRICIHTAEEFDDREELGQS